MSYCKSDSMAYIATTPPECNQFHVVWSPKCEIFASGHDNKHSFSIKFGMGQQLNTVNAEGTRDAKYYNKYT